MFKPNYQLSNRIVNDIAKISEDREAILGSPILPSIEAQLRQDALLSRTYHSTSIEGNPLSLPQVKVIMDGGKLVARKKDKQEITNYIKTLRYLDSIAGKSALTEKMILKIQALLTNKILSPKDSGKYRQRMVYVVNKFGQTVFTPPPSKAVPDLVKDLAAWLNSSGSSKLHPILAAGIAHYELVRIHPFIDGNGRAARALATLILYQKDFDLKHFFALDDYYNEDRAAYYTALKYVDPRSRDLTEWLEYFAEGVASQMNKLRKKLDVLRHEPIFKNLPKRLILKERQWKLLEALKERSRITNLEYQQIAGITRETAKRDLAFLVKEGILNKSGKGRSIYYEFL